MVNTRPRVGWHRAQLATIIASVLIAAFVAACGGGGSSSSNAGDIAGTGKVQGDGGEIVFFSVATSNPYIAKQVQSAQAEADKLDYKLKVIVNNFDASQLQQQIQQQIASGQKPKAFILFALDQKAAINQARQLSRIAPVFQINQAVASEGFEYVKAYVGPSDVLIGQTAGQTLISLRDELQARNVALHSPQGNLLAISAEPGLQTTKDRWTGLTEAIKDKPFNILQNQDCCSDPEKAYQMASQLVPKYKSQLDFVFAQNVDAAGGVVRALQENGLQPGVNVWVVAGNCGGPRKLLADGDVYGAGAQLPTVEGAAMIQTIAQYFATGKVDKTTATIDYSEQTPEVTVTPPAQVRYLSNPPVIGVDALSKIVWGQTVESSCPMS